mgnify:CR=1 FL=1
MGRPRKFNTNKELEVRIDDYLAICKEKKEIPNKAGLCLHLGMTRQSYSRYKDLEIFSDTIKKGELKIENAWIQRLSGVSPVGAIFYMKNAFREDYKDRTETDVTSGGKPLPTPILSYVQSDTSASQNSQT